MIVRILVAAVAVAIGASSVVAQQDAIAARKALMKATGAQTAAAVKMVKGDEPFDLAKAKAVFVAYQDAAAKGPGLFPATAKEGGETTAAPKIWENKADFEAKFAKFGADAKAAEAKVVDLATFKTVFPDISKNCGGCHNEYRVKK